MPVMTDRAPASQPPQPPNAPAPSGETWTVMRLVEWSARYLGWAPPVYPNGGGTSLEVP